MLLRSSRYRLARRVSLAAVTFLLFLVVGTTPLLADANRHTGSAVSPALRAQARTLYGPVRTYERSTTRAEKAGSRSTARRVGRMISRCQAPYLKRLTQRLSKQGRSLYALWNNATLLETYQAYAQPVATQLATLAGSWAALSFRSRPMNTFVHALAAEFRATLDAAPFDSCGFVKAIAAHHFSYAWAKTSSSGLQATRWWHQILKAGDHTAPFWKYVNAAGLDTAPGPGAHLFTQAQLTVLANLPAELS